MSYKKNINQPQQDEKKVATKEELVAIADREIKRIEDKESNIYFFVIDTKDVPSGSLANIYEMAYYLKTIGYKVAMLHTEEEFVGVGNWMGEKYNELQHLNIEKDTVPLAMGDLLIIPEIFANVIEQTKTSPCKRIALVQNYPYVSEFMPVTRQWGDYKMMNAIVTSNAIDELMKETFPYVKTKMIQPCVFPVYRESDMPKDMGVNIVCRNPNDFHKIVKPFYWMHPEYKWVSFYHLADLPQDTMAETLRRNPITIWWDTACGFGYAAVEAMKSGSVVIGKRPDIIPDWMLEEDGETLKNNGIWFDTLPELYDILFGMVQGFITDTIPQELYTEMKKTADFYNVETYHKQIEDVFQAYLNERKEEINVLKSQISNLKDNEE